MSSSSELREPLIENGMIEKTQKVPSLRLTNGIELPAMTVVPLLNLDPPQKQQIFQAALEAGYRHIDLSNVRMGTTSLVSSVLATDSGSLPNGQRMAKRRENFLTAKLLLDDNETLARKLDDTFGCLQIDHLDLLLIGLPDSGWLKRQGDDGITQESITLSDVEKGEPIATADVNIEKLVATWRFAEQMYKEGKVKALGVSRMEPKLVEQLCNRAHVKPHCWQLDLQPLMDNFEEVLELANRQKIVPIVRANALGASSKFGSLPQRGFYHTLLREMAAKYKKSATQILCRWLYQRGMAVVCSCGVPQRIVTQTGIFDFRLSPEDMQRLNGLYNRSSLPSPYELSQKASASARGARLQHAHRLCADLALADALLGLLLMVLAMELTFAGLQFWAELALWCLLASTVILLALTARFHWLETKYYMHRNVLQCWQYALPMSQRVQIALELCVCAVSPLPVLHSARTDAYLCSLMFARAFWLPRVLHLHSRLSTDTAARSIAGLNRVKTNTRFMLKRMLFLQPGLLLSTFVFGFWIIGAYILRLCESKMDDHKILDYYNTLWMMSVTFLTIGYGDIYPVTTCGRLMAVLTGIVGVCVASMIVAVIVQKISLSHSEERLNKFLAKSKNEKSLKITAATVLKESWLLYKNRKAGDQVKARFHQHRQNAAICRLRKLRKCRKQFKDEASIEDVARTLHNAAEVVQRQEIIHQNANERLAKLEHGLEGIQKSLERLEKLFANKR